MKPPCEVIVWYVIPTIRAELAKELVKMGMSQKEISHATRHHPVRRLPVYQR